MSRNGSGTYQLPAGNPVVSGTIITDTWANTTLGDIGNELTNSLPRDGQAPPLANLPMGGYKLTGLGQGTLRTDSAALGQLQDSSIQWLTAVAGTNSITASLNPPITSYVAGQTYRFTAAGANTGAVTLSINGISAAAVTKQGSVALAAGDIQAGAVVQVVYDGTRFQAVGIYSITSDASGYAYGLTPPQFDNSTKLITTAFITAFGMQASGVSTVSTTGTVPLSSVGGAELWGNSSPITRTLMALSTVPIGGRIEFFNVGTATVTLNAAAADGANAIAVNGGARISSFSVGQGDSLILEKASSGYWAANGGSAQLQYSASFGSSLGTSGYQKLPGGLILQWGQFTQTDTGSSVAFTWTPPIAFPTASYQAFLTVGNSPSGASCSVEGLGTAAITGFTNAPAGSRTYRIFAIGR